MTLQMHDLRYGQTKDTGSAWSQAARIRGVWVYYNWGYYRISFNEIIKIENPIKTIGKEK